ncbi:hypothetical protein E6R60_26500 [Streptomyces sp. A0642]|nr:hypothetical protein E6R60_26500 [Streptomyces sp. A0642]
MACANLGWLCRTWFSARAGAVAGGGWRQRPRSLPRWRSPARAAGARRGSCAGASGRPRRGCGGPGRGRRPVGPGRTRQAGRRPQTAGVRCSP